MIGRIISASDKPLARFLLVFLILYALWYFVYELFLHPAGTIDDWIIRNSVAITSWGLSLLGFQVETSSSFQWYSIRVNNGYDIWVGQECNGLSLFILFTIFILAFPGKLFYKVVFIPAGILTIHLLNCIRIGLMTIIAFRFPDWLQFNHTYTFTILIYLYIFFLWYIWINRYSAIAKKIN